MNMHAYCPSAALRDVETHRQWSIALITFLLLNADTELCSINPVVFLFFRVLLRVGGRWLRVRIPPGKCLPGESNRARPCCTSAAADQPQPQRHSDLGNRKLASLQVAIVWSRLVSSCRREDSTNRLRGRPVGKGCIPQAKHAANRYRHQGTGAIQAAPQGANKARITGTGCSSLEATAARPGRAAAPSGLIRAQALRAWGPRSDC